MPAEASRHGALASGAFRFALLLALVFACGAGLLLWTVERQVGGFATQATETMLRNEAEVLAGEYDQLGLLGLTDALKRHSSAGEEAQFHYLLLDGQGRRVFGTLPVGAATIGWGETRIEEPGAPVVFKRYGQRLPDGLTLVVATDTFDIDSVRQRLVRFTILSGLGITLFALVGGYLAGRMFLGRLDRVNRAVDRIIDGDGQERLPSIGVAPEFDHLTRNLNRMIDRQAAAMDAVRQVSTAIAHDLRTPLTRLRESLEIMRETEAADPAAIDAAVAQTEDILATFQALLRIGMMEGGVGRKRFAPVDLGALMDRVCEVYEPVVEDADHRLVGDHQPGLFVEGDAEMLTQLFINLVENAIVHTPAGVTISTTLRAQDNLLVASVRDDGPGVADVDRDKIFRKFYRADASRSTPGAGLGLSLVAAIAELHQASIRLVPAQSGFHIEIVFAGRG